MNRPLIIMDMPVLCGRSAFTYNGRYQDGQGRSANITFPIFQIIKSMMKRWDTDRFFFCWDGDESYRQGILPSYTPKFDNILSTDLPQMKRLKEELLPECGFGNHYTMPKHGSNDCIYNVLRENMQDSVVVRSFDDYHFHLFRLFEDNDFDFCIETKNTEYIEWYDFKELYGVQPKYWFMVLAIAGSTLHHMPGVPDVGMKRAIQVVQGKSHAKYNHLVEQNRNVVERNMALVEPVENDPPTEMPCRKRLDQIVKSIDSFGFIDSWTRIR